MPTTYTLYIKGQINSQIEDVKLPGGKADNKLKSETQGKSTKSNQKVSACDSVKILLGEQKSQLLFNSVVMSIFPIARSFGSFVAQLRIMK